jgi:hypothetical protein
VSVQSKNRPLRAARDLVADLAHLAWVLPGVEIGRITRGPLPLVSELRLRAQTTPLRDESRRATLQRLISALDRRMPGGPNCYRRVLLEIRLDRGAAGQPIHIGLLSGGGPRSGHAWLGENRGRPEPYDVEIAV